MVTEIELQQAEQAVREARIDAEQYKTQNYQQEIMMGQQDKSMIREQLDLGEELERIDYLLRGWTIEVNEQSGVGRWAKPQDNSMIILSDYGVHLIRNTIAWYLNKNTLLSNYDEDTILSKMEDFASDLNDTVFMEYEKVFQYPTFLDCQKILDERLKKKLDLKVYSQELLLSKKLSETDKQILRDKVLKEIEPIIERELSKIKEQIIKDKLKRFLILIREVQDAVHSTYLRAWKGQERTTLRQHIHISENKGGIPQQQQQTSMNPLNWITRR